MENTENKPKRKVKRNIKKFDFSDENATVSLVGPSVGGAANSYITLVTKSNKNVSEEFLQKASQITVTMSINEYLQRFFGIWCSADQELLARSLGFTTEGMDKAVVEQQEEMLDANEPPEQPDCWESKPGDTEYEKWINYKLQSIQVMKSLFEADNIEEAIVNLSEEDYLKVLQDQEIVEKAFVEIEKACKGKGTKPVKKNSSANAGDNSTNNVDVENGGDISPVVKNKNKEKSMTQEVQKTVGVVEKAEFEAIQKQLADNQAELQKALDLVKQFEAEKKEAIAKARKEELTKACGKHAEVIFKAVGECEEETFVEVVKALAEMQELIEKSALFQEQGASVSDGEINEESPIAKALQARLAKRNKQ